MKLRDPYQRLAVERAIALLDGGASSTLIVLPTGCGKTVVFAKIAAHYAQHGRVLVIAHRAELIYQAVDKLGRVTGYAPDIEMAGQYADRPTFYGERAQFIVSSIQTQISGMGGDGRMTRFDPDDFALVIIDEAHHATAASYRKVIDYYRRNPRLKVLGVTATPDRADEMALGQVFDTVAFRYDIEDAVNDGWLVEPVQRLVHGADMDFSRVRTRAGDLHPGDVAALMESEGPMHTVAHPTFEWANGFAEGYIDSISDDKLLTYRPDWQEELTRQLATARRRRTLVFTASVAQASSLHDIFNRWAPGSARFIDGKTDEADRRKTLKDYRAGKFQFLCNCAVFTEGFDEPGVEVVSVARPTKSRSLYVQMVGRGTRPLDGLVDPHETPQARCAAIAASDKPHLLVLDFVGNSGQHKLITCLDILGGKWPDEVRQLAARKLEESGEAMTAREAMEVAEEELERRRLEAEERKAKDAAAKARLVGVAHYSTEIVSAFDRAGVKPKPVVAWMKDQRASPGQIEYLRRLGVDNAAELSRVHASQLIDSLTAKQHRGQKGKGWYTAPHRSPQTARSA